MCLNYSIIKTFFKHIISILLVTTILLPFAVQFVHSFEKHEHSVCHSQNKTHFDSHEIPLEDNRFDVVFCNHVMEHVENPLQCMKELYRVMKKGGWALIQVPQDFNRDLTYEDASITSPKEREKHFWQKDHLRLFGKDYPQWLEKAGFIVEEFDLNKLFDKNEINIEHLIKASLLLNA